MDDIQWGPGAIGAAAMGALIAAGQLLHKKARKASYLDSDKRFRELQEYVIEMERTVNSKIQAIRQEQDADRIKRHQERMEDDQHRVKVNILLESIADNVSGLRKLVTQGRGATLQDVLDLQRPGA